MTSQEEFLLEREQAIASVAIKQLELRETESRRKSYIRIFIGTFLGIVVSACMLFLFTKEIPEGNKDVVIALVSGLTGAFFGSVVTFYFGDSDSRSESVPTVPESNRYNDQPLPNESSPDSKKVIEEPKVSDDIKKE